MGKTLERAMNSEHEELAARYADECARTLLAYYQAEDAVEHCTDYDAALGKCDETWSDHKNALDRFERTFPMVEWRDHAEKALLAEIERNHP